MKPRTLRERRLLRRAYQLLNEAAGEKLPVTKIGKSKPGAWKSGTKSTVTNAHIGTISELVSIWYCTLNLKDIFGGVPVESKTIGKDSDGESVAVDLNGTIKRLQSYCNMYKKDKFMNVYNQGLTQGRAMMATVQDIIEIKDGTKEESDWLKPEEIEKIKAGNITKIRILGLGESADLVDASIKGQEDCQIIFEYEGEDPETGLTTTMLYSNKAGGSSPAQLNKTPVSVGVITKEDLKTELTNSIGQIKTKSIELYNTLNKDVPIPKGTIAGAAAIKKGTSKQDFWWSMLITQLANAGDSYKGTKNDPNKGVDECFNLGRKGETFPKANKKGPKKGTKQDPADYGAGGWNTIRPARSAKFGNTSLSSCCTSIMGQLAGDILEEALEEELANPELLFDLIMGAGKNSSIWSTMYPSGNLLDEQVEGEEPPPIPTRKVIAQRALDAILGQKGRYFAVTGKKDTATSMQSVHGGFITMLTAVSQAQEEIEGSRFGISKSDDVNGLTFTFDDAPLLTITMRKDTSGKAAYSKASIMLSATDSAKTIAKVITDKEDKKGDGTGTMPVGEEGAEVQVQKATGDEPKGTPVKTLSGKLNPDEQPKEVKPDLKKGLGKVDVMSLLKDLKFSSSVATVDWTLVGSVLGDAGVKANKRALGVSTLQRMPLDSKIAVAQAVMDGKKEVSVSIKPSKGGKPVTIPISIPTGTKEKFEKKVVDPLNKGKIQDSYDPRISRRLEGIISETLSILFETDVRAMISDMSEDELDELLASMGLEAEIVEEGSQNIGDMLNSSIEETINESRWLKLAGLLKD